jgi:hypothetical protein
MFRQSNRRFQAARRNFQVLIEVIASNVAYRIMFHQASDPNSTLVVSVVPHPARSLLKMKFTLET